MSIVLFRQTIGKADTRGLMVSADSSQEEKNLTIKFEWIPVMDDGTLCGERAWVLYLCARFIDKWEVHVHWDGFSTSILTYPDNVVLQASQVMEYLERLRIVACEVRDRLNLAAEVKANYAAAMGDNT